MAPDFQKDNGAGTPPSDEALQLERMASNHQGMKQQLERMAMMPPSRAHLPTHARGQ
jgi:hypothetical protein